MRREGAALAFLLFLTAAPALAVRPDEMLADPTLEARARAISGELRCVVCQNETIDESDAPLAHDLRVILRERLKAGDTNAQAKAFLVKRYGDFVLLRPPVKPTTWLLWFGPGLMAAVGGAGVVLYLRQRSKGLDEADLGEPELGEEA